MSLMNSNLDNYLEQPKLLYSVIFLFAFTLYGNTLFNGYALDDHLVTTANHEQISKGISAIPDIFTSHYVTWHDYKVDYRPLVKATFAIEYEIFGENPGLSHFINVLLYAITCMLLWGLLIKIFPFEKQWLLFLALLIFMAHPVHTEVVASLKGRDELLSFLFLILGFRAFLIWSENRNWRWMILAAIALYLSLISKASSVPWMAVIGFVLLFMKKEKPINLLVTASLMVGVVVFHFGVISILFDDIIRSHIFIETPFFLSDDSSIKWPSIIVTAGHYLKLLVAPIPLCSYYGYDQISLTNWGNWKVYTTIAAYSVLMFLAIRSLKRQTLISLGALILLLDIAPFLNLIYPYTGVLGERVLYGATLGFGLMVVGLIKVMPHKQKLILPMIGLLILAGSLKTISRNFDWKDNLTLFTADAANCDRSVKMQQLYAHHLRQEYIDKPETFTTAQANEALIAYQKGIDLYDGWPITHYGAGNVLFFDLGNAQRAVPYYLKAVELNPNYSDAQYDLLNAYLELGDFANAEKIMNVLIAMFPDDESLFDRVLKALFTEVQLDQAERINQQFLESFPKLDLPHIYQGNVNIAKGDTLGALLHFEKALEFNPNYGDLEDYLNHLRKELGN